MISDTRVRPISELIRELEIKLSDAEWDLDFTSADKYYEELQYYRKRQKEGDLYVPNF
jgi:hypothetical protein